MGIYSSQNLTREQRAIEAFRQRAFHIAFDSLYATVTDNALRFGLAIVHSAQPIPPERMRLVHEWYATTREARRDERRELAKIARQKRLAKTGSGQ